VLHSAWDVAGSLGNLHCLFASHAFDSANEEKMMKIHETTWKHMESMPV
jgi:sigma54-dependent transcription regulator